MTTFKQLQASQAASPRARLRAAVRAVRVLLAFGFQAGPAQWTALLVATAFNPIAGLAAAYAAKLLTDAVLHREWNGVLAAAGLAAGGQIVQSACSLTYLRLVILNAERAGELLDRHLVELIARIPGIEHFERADYADEVALVRGQRNLLAETTNAFIQNIQVWVGLVASAALLYRLHPAMVLVPLFGLGSLWTGRKVNALNQARDEANAERDRARHHVRTLATTDGPAKELRVFGLAEEMIQRYGALAESMHRESERKAWKVAGLEILGSLCFAVGYVGSLALALDRAIQGALTPGDVVLAVALVAQMNGTLAGVVGTANYLGRAAKAANRYVWLTDYAAAARRGADSPAAVPDRLERGIALEGVTFTYPGTDAVVLDDVSLELPAGTVVAIVGENGAGKTTLVKLLSRFYEPQEGRVTVDGIDLRRFDVDEWRERMTAGYQDFSRFELLAGQTVGVGDLPRVADAPALAGALERASAADVTAHLPRGLETQLGKSWKDGVELSGGQWQKLALARALMRTDPLVVAFDEPTAALDAQTEHALFERFAAAARTGSGRGSVTILVSHRFSTVRMADLIVVLDKGKIVEQGTHAALMARRGLYAELYSLQAAAYN